MSNAPLKSFGDAPDEEIQRFHVGDHVRDREGVAEATILVTGIPGTSAREYVISGTKTVADYNPEYDPFDETIECKIPSRTDNDLGSIKEYAYPSRRLELVEPIHEIESDAESSGENNE